LKIPGGLLCDRRDAPDKKSLRESARILGLVWEDKRYTKSTRGPATYDRTRLRASREVSRSCQLCSYQRRKGNLFDVLISIKVPSGFSSNIKGIINMADKKFQNLKSHDCHVLMMQLLPVALRGIVLENV
jgi:hypothetical protein